MGKRECTAESLVFHYDTLQKPPNVDEQSHKNPKPSLPASQRVLLGHITSQAAVLQDEGQGTRHNVMTAGEEWEWDKGEADLGSVRFRVEQERCVKLTEKGGSVVM